MSEYKKTQIIAVEYKTGVINTDPINIGGNDYSVPNQWANAPTIPNNYPPTSNQLMTRAAEIFNQNVPRPLTFEQFDMEKRLMYFAFVSGKIIDSCNKNADNDSILKCILWPEFYWSPENTGAYTMEDYRRLKKILRELLQEELFKDTLVVNGTIVWKMGIGERRSENWPANNTEETYFNCSLINYNGPDDIKMDHNPLKPNSEQKRFENSFIIQKAHLSHIDGVPDFLFGEGMIHSTGNTVSANQFDYYKTLRAENKHVFKIGSLKIGLDICLEHVKELLSKAIIDVFNNGDATKSTNVLDIQLLTACGMGMDKNSVFLTTKGTFGRTDGINPNSSCAYRTNSTENTPSSINNIAAAEAIPKENNVAGSQVIARVYPVMQLPTH